MTAPKVRRPLDEVLGEIEPISREHVEYLRSLTFAQKVAMVGELNRCVRQHMVERLRTQHPDWTDQQFQTEVARKILNESEEDILNFVA